MINKLKKNIFAFLISFFLIYFLFSLFGGDRGLISQINKQQKLENLLKKEVEIIDKIEEIVLKNSLLTTNLDIDYIETLIRDKFIFGKNGEKIYIINEDED